MLKPVNVEPLRTEAQGCWGLCECFGGTVGDVSSLCSTGDVILQVKPTRLFLSHRKQFSVGIYEGYLAFPEPILNNLFPDMYILNVTFLILELEHCERMKV